jgi:4-hydroxy-tetrahydrodipicolinate synthase
MKALFAAPSPAPVKSALNMRGLNVGGVRLPLVPLNDEEQRALQIALQPSNAEAILLNK